MTVSTVLKINGRRHRERTLVLAHGAGAGMDSPFLDTVARGLARRSIRVIRFEFPYMVRRREEGTRRPPDREPTLLQSWLSVVERVGSPRSTVIGGKSMGGRIASRVADQAGVAGLVCLGYPFHPPGRQDKLRTEHLATLKTPALIVQGSRDPFGTREEIGGYLLAPTIRVEYAEDGDHSLKPRKRSGRTEPQNLLQAIEWISEFVHRRVD